MEIWKRGADGKYALLKTFPICRWSGQLGPKVREGDRQAPEGFYTITPAQMNPNSAYYLSFDTGFPNAYDRAHGRTGSAPDGARLLLVARLLRHDGRGDRRDLRHRPRVLRRRPARLPVPVLSVPHDGREPGEAPLRSAHRLLEEPQGRLGLLRGHRRRAAGRRRRAAATCSTAATATPAGSGRRPEAPAGRAGGGRRSSPRACQPSSSSTTTAAGTNPSARPFASAAGDDGSLAVEPAPARNARRREPARRPRHRPARDRPRRQWQGRERAPATALAFAAAARPHRPSSRSRLLAVAGATTRRTVTRRRPAPADAVLQADDRRYRRSLQPCPRVETTAQSPATAARRPPRRRPRPPPHRRSPAQRAGGRERGRRHGD